MLSHAYGSRHINRTADHNSALIPVNFLEEVFQTFPDLTIYPLLRDVFPATRLRKRGAGEAAFEIASAGDHSTFLRNTAMEQVRDIIPVYTFATLHVVEEDKRPQSGFCTYFLVSDRRVSNIDWIGRARETLINSRGQSSEHSCLLTVLRGLHFIEAERGVKKGQLVPVLDPFSWISPTTKEAAGEVEIFHSRRRGRVHLSYPAVLTPHCPGAAQESSPWKITFWCRRPPGVAFFELAVQRGVIAQLLHQKLLSPAHPSLEPWHTSRVSEVTKGVLKALAVTDNNAREWVESGVRHLLVFGYGLGWTTMRECLKHNAPKNPQIEALWCPLTLPGQEGKFEEEQEKTAISFHQAFQLPGSPDKAVTHKGNPGKADFLLWLKSGGTHRRRSKRPKDFLLCLEFFLQRPGKTGGLQD